MTEAEIEKLKSEHSAMKKIIESIQKQVGGPFICGHAGPYDAVGLGETILVCPKEGLAGFAVYKKSSSYSEPGY